MQLGVWLGVSVGVVSLDQHLGAAHFKSWSKSLSILVFVSFLKILNKKQHFCLIVNNQSTKKAHVFLPVILQLFISEHELLTVYKCPAFLCKTALGKKTKNIIFTTYFFNSASKSCINIQKHGKGRYQPGFGVHSTQTLVKKQRIYNRWVLEGG